MYEDSRADWTLEQHTASLACSVKAEGSEEWAACRRMVLHHLEYERLHRELMAVIETDLTGRQVERLSREQSRAMKLMCAALRELEALQTQRWREMQRERQREIPPHGEYRRREPVH